MKRLKIYLIVLTALVFSCNSGKSDAETSAEKLAIDWQETFKSVDAEKLKPFLDEENYTYLKSYLGDSEEILENTRTALKDQKNEVVSSKVNENDATVTICCDAYGEEFVLHLKKVEDNWKVNFIKTMEGY